MLGIWNHTIGRSIKAPTVSPAGPGALKAESPGGTEAQPWADIHSVEKSVLCRVKQVEQTSQVPGLGDSNAT